MAATRECEQHMRRVLEAVAKRDDLMNDPMSLGAHRLWERSLVRMAQPRAQQVIGDLAGGTGDVAARMAGADRFVAVCNPRLPTMQVGRDRGLAHVRWLASTADRLPLADASVDTVTIAFGIRNVTQLDAALAEALRVCKPRRPLPVLRVLDALGTGATVLPLILVRRDPAPDAWIVRSPEACRHLVGSTRRFPDRARSAR